MTRWERMAEHKGKGDQADIRNFFARRVGRGNMEKRDRIAGGFYGLLVGDTKIPASRTAGAGKSGRAVGTAPG